MESSYILGISAFYHDSAAVLLKGSEVIAAAQEERFTRRKHDQAFPSNAVSWCLKEAGIAMEDVSIVAFYDKPMLKFERLLQTYYAYAPKGLISFAKSMPVWIREKLFLKDVLSRELKRLGKFDRSKISLLFPEHHLSHAASVFFVSPFESAAILTIDGVGEWATASICKGEGNKITILKEMHFPHSIGLLYSAFTYYLGFRVNTGEYKLMGLAPYGNKGSESVERFKQIIRSHLMQLNEDGSVWLNPDYFTYATGLRMVPDSKWEKLFGFPRRESESEILQEHSDLALAIQELTEEAVMKLALHAKELCDEDKLCLSGGVALNCVANGKLLRSGHFSDIYIQPAAGDAGGALGAALAAAHINEGLKRRISGDEQINYAQLGPHFSDPDIREMISKYKANASCISEVSLLFEKTVKLLEAGAIVGWFQGRMEWGPRALGNRSILADPRRADIQKKLNLEIKFRESFRPFAPVIIEEHASKYFELDRPSPYMLLVAPVLSNHLIPLPENFASLNIREKLYLQRSLFPAITHVDLSARIQTVNEKSNARLYGLLKKLNEKTNCPMLVNTSFNVRGEPIVMTPEHAYRCFMRSGMDALVIGNFLFLKEDQPLWNEPSNWKKEMVLD